MDDAQDFDPIYPNAIDNNERGGSDDQFTRAFYATDPPRLWIRAQEPIRTLQNGKRHGQGALRALVLNMIEDLVEFGLCPREPENGNGQPPCAFSREIRASSLAITSSCRTHCVAGSSASLIPISTCSRNHLSCSAASWRAFIRTA
jgi:hypothetical protein